MGEAKKYILYLFKIFRFIFVNVSDVLKLYQNDETHPKSRNHWQVRDALWCVAQEDGEEDGGVAARHLHLPLLRQGLFEETGVKEEECVGIWHCKGCRKTIAGGAWTHSTTAAVTVRSAIRRLREIREQASIGLFSPQ